MSGSTTCASGSPRRTLNSTTFGPSRVSIRPTYRKPAERAPFGAHAVDDGCDDFVENPARRGRRRSAGSARRRPSRRCSGPGRRRRRACGPAPRPSGTAARPSVSTKNDASRPSRNSSMTRRAPASPNRLSTIASHTAASAACPIGRDDDALAGRQAVGLQDDRVAELAARDDAKRGIGIAADAVARRRHAVARHERLGERLARFERRGLAGRPDDGAARQRQRIDDTPSSAAARVRRPSGRALHGSRERQDGLRVCRIDGHAGGQAGDPGIAGGTEMRDTERSRESAQTSACSRPPPPTTSTVISGLLLTLSRCKQGGNGICDNCDSLAYSGDIDRLTRQPGRRRGCDQAWLK